ncbi:MAG: ATP-binding cassette domain-containing protein, partial [Clostridia bacterium]|nr:ATP-binding cassette domain-containing protein [Clostridia bacterium]
MHWASATISTAPSRAIPPTWTTSSATRATAPTPFIDGTDIMDISIRSVREGCAYVPQDNFLFSDTIANNINFAYDELDEEAVEVSAALADVHDNISEFKDGYRTVLGERGVTVSGGQKQRISIARALMKNAPILIMDDAVSAVDTDTEKV